MITHGQRIGLVLAVYGGAAGLASAQPYGVNGTGATLLEALFRAPANTLDFIDADNDGIVQEQLAPFDATFPFIASQHWQFTYRVVGSVNGFEEHRDWSILFATAPNNDQQNITLNSSFADAAYFNSQQFVAAGMTQGVANPNNPGATPFRVLNNGTYQITTGAGANTGVQMDFSALDVPATWAVRQPGSARFNRVPGAPGYGENDRGAVNKDGTPAIDPVSGDQQDNLLAILDSRTGLSLNTNVANPNEFTLFDTPVTLTPVAAMVNYGAGIQQIDMSDLRHGYATGRRINGENLEFITRDVGSGTRNAFANGIGLDPSWCVGENIGPRVVSSAADRLGPNYQPSNKGGSSRVEATVINHRLSIGHTGAERGQSGGWLTNRRADVLAVKGDLRGGTVYARPNIQNVVDGGPDGYSIVGLGGVVTVGDPRSAPANKGGWGWDPSEIGPNPNPNPQVRNVEAAAYVNNITRSIAAITAVPNDPANAFSPGEFLAIQFVLPATSFNILAINPDPTADVIPAVPNPDRNPVLTDFVLNDPNNVLALPQYQSFNQNAGGLNPQRTIGVVYSDGVANGAHYISIDGTRIDYATYLGDTNGNTLMNNPRNKIAGDFNGDGMRSPADVPDMIAAWRFRHDGGNWNGGSAASPAQRGRACPEILGDFNGDGNFDAEDVRYWADGLHMVDGMLDRKAGFIAVDQAFGGNFFGTTLVTGVPYKDGDSRGDIDGSPDTRGWAPNGHDGVIDDRDIDSVCRNFGVWSNLEDAVMIDLSADINGDLVIDYNDVVELVVEILGTEIGDINLDGVVDQLDLDIAMANLGMEGGWAMGDVNCDGVIDAADIAIIQAAINAGCIADFNNDGQVNFFDVSAFMAAFNAQDPSADINGDGIFNFFDVSAFIAAFNTGCP
ncbi:MAG: dockerin type I domain-containing protein [Phycisphaerales bacterium]|nr:hypothetical protein [Planctomycetota bacterium]MCH8509549.1 dockerin type I domain-containing protein [Phycisphaerales bacterium]